MPRPHVIAVDLAFLSLVEILARDEPTFERPKRGDASDEHEGQRGQQMDPVWCVKSDLLPYAKKNARHTCKADYEERGTISGICKRVVEIAHFAFRLKRQEPVEKMEAIRQS